MQIIKKHDKSADIIFQIGLLIHLFVMVVGYGEWSIPYQGRLLQIAFGLFASKILMTYYSKKEWVILLAVGVLGVVSYLFTRDEYVLSVMVMIFAAKSTDMRQICKRILIVASVATMVIAVLSLFGIGGIPVDVRDYGRGAIEARWCLGFGHANNFHGTLLYLLVLVVYLYFERITWVHYLILTGCNILIYQLTVSKAGLLVVQMVIGAAFLLRYKKVLEEKSWIYFLGFLGTIALYVISIISVSVEWTKSSLLVLLDRLLTGRINLAYQHAHISTWKILESAGELGVVDNGFVAMFFNYGYIVGITFMLFFLLLLYASWRRKSGILLIIIITSVLYTFMESTYMTNPTYLLSNLSYIVAMLLLSDKKEQINESGKLEN